VTKNKEQTDDPRKYTTDINCGNCVAAVTPYLNAERSIRQWSVNTADPNKVLTIEGDGVHSATIRRLVAGAGFRVLDELQTPVPSATNDVDRKKHAGRRPSLAPKAPNTLCLPRRSIQCAMSYVTLFEDVLMVLMAGFMLLYLYRA